MSPEGERVIRVQASDTSAPEGKQDSFSIEHEEDRLPDTPEKIAELLRRNLKEIQTRELTGKGELSEEAEFVSRLENAMAEFYKERGAHIPPERRPSLSYFVSVLDGSIKNISLPPMEVRALMEHIQERFGVPKREDLTVLVDETPVKGQAGRIDAHRRVLDGLTESWKRLLQESWRQYNAEQFPVRVRGEVEDIATTESYQYQQALINSLIDRVARGTPERFRKFMKALVDQSVGMKGEVVTATELRAFADYIAPRLPKEQAIPADEIYEHMRRAAPNKGAVAIPREVLSLIITGFARDIRAVHELANPEQLYMSSTEMRSSFNAVRETWEKFTTPQKMQFLEMVRANFVVVEPKKNEGARTREGKKIPLREELRDQCKKLSKILSSENSVISDKEIDLLAKLIELRTTEIMDYRTRPEQQVEVEEAKEQKTMTPTELLAEVTDRLSYTNAYVSPILRTLMRPDMAQGRSVVFSAFMDTVGKAGKKSELVSRMQQRLHTGISEIDIRAIQTVIDLEGESENKRGWELILQAGNGTHAFRERMLGLQKK